MIFTRLLMQTFFLNSDNVTKRGYLTYQENALDDKWVKRWLVLRR